jgi:hypothetical protein
MNCEDIQAALNELKVNSKGHIRGKNRAIDKIHSMHLKKYVSVLMDVRVFVAKVSTGHDTETALRLIDEFIYRKQL